MPGIESVIGGGDVLVERCRWFKKDNGYKAVPLPPLADLSFAGLDDSVYRPTANKTSASVSQVETSTSQTSNTSVEMPRVESVRPSGVIIKDWVSDDEDIFQSNDLQATDKPSFKRIEFTNARNESVKPKQADKPRIITQNPKVDRRDWNGQMTQKLGLGFGFTKKACFVCGSYSHLIKDCDFHEKRMAKKSVLKNMGKNSGQREIRPVWNSAQRINHQNKFVPSAVLTRFGRVPVSAAKQSSLRATTSTSTFRPVNTATHTNRVNVSKLKTNAFHKSHSPIRRSFYKSTAPNTRISNEKVNTVRVNGVNTAGQTAVSTVKGTGVTAVKASAGCVWRPKMTDLNNVSKDNSGSWVSKRGNPQQALKNKGIFDSGCSRHMTGNKDFLTDYQDIDGGFVAFGGSARGGKITGKGKIRTDKLDFEDVFFVKELKFNLFSVSQMCDKKNSVLFTETECLVLSPDFKLLDESQVLLRVPRQSNMYSFDLKNVVPSGDLTCLFAKATIDESKLWHRRLGHVNFKTMNKLVKGNLVRGLPSKIFDNDHTCVACQKGKQHKASCKAKLMSSISQPLQMLHMDLFGPTSVRSINHKTYCLVVTDDFSRFSWVFFLASKDETSGILKRFITEIENQLNHKVKVIRCDNETGYGFMGAGWQVSCAKYSWGASSLRWSARVLEQPVKPPLSEGHTSGSREGRMEHQFALTANVPITPHDSPLPGGYTPGSDDGRLKLQELMTMCTKLSKQVLDLEKEKDAQAVEILRLKKRVKRLETQRKSSLLTTQEEEIQNRLEAKEEKCTMAVAAYQVPSKSMLKCSNNI
ncbi:putative ribonuclease H-like domain-containing protein [Tanacetum coccineum]